MGGLTDRPFEFPLILTIYALSAARSRPPPLSTRTARIGAIRPVARSHVHPPARPASQRDTHTNSKHGSVAPGVGRARSAEARLDAAADALRRAPSVARVTIKRGSGGSTPRDGAATTELLIATG